MYQESILDERVEVIARFSAGGRPCLPVKFRRKNGQEVAVSKLGLGYPYKQGSKTVHIFDVTDGRADYRLEFDSVALTWTLTREASHGE